MRNWYGDSTMATRWLSMPSSVVTRTACFAWSRSGSTIRPAPRTQRRRYFCAPIVASAGSAFAPSRFTWLFRTARLVCLEMNRQRRYEPLPAVDPPAADSGDSAVALAEVRALVSDLPARQREVVMLRIFEDLSVRETARAMGCREGTVKALLNKARATAGRELQRMNDAGTDRNSATAIATLRHRQSLPHAFAMPRRMKIPVHVVVGCCR